VVWESFDVCVEGPTIFCNMTFVYFIFNFL
jgi:hypothetical protein